MAITFFNQYTLQAGSTSVTLNPPASTAAGDMVILFLANKLSTNTPGAVTGFTQIGQSVVGTGSNGAGTGPILLTAWSKELTGAAGNSTITVTSGNVMLAGGMVYRKGAGETWATPTVKFGSDTSSGTGFSASMSAQDGYGVGDWQVSFGATTANVTLSARSTTLPGCTATLTGINSGGSATGNDIFVWTDHRGPVTAGSQTGVGTTTATTSAATTGGAVQVRISLQTTVTGTLSAQTPTTQAAITGSANGPIATGTLTATVPTTAASSAGTVTAPTGLVLESSPTLVFGSSTPWTTTSFTPPNNSLLLVAVMADWFNGTPTITLTDSLSQLTFTQQHRQGANNQGLVELYTAEVGSFGGTRTISGATSISSKLGGLKVWVLTGYDPAILDAATVGGGSTTQNLTVNGPTTVTDGAWVFGGAVDWNALGPATSSDQFENGGSTGNLDIIAVWKATATSPAGTPTLNFQAAASGPQWTWAGIAIRPVSAAGTYTGTLSASLPRAQAAATGTAAGPAYTATLAASTPAVTSAASGTVTAPTYTGTLAAQTPRATSSTSGTATAPTYTGSLSAAVPVAQAASTGTAAGPAYTGSLTAATPVATANIAGTATEPSGSATLAAAVPVTTATITGTVTAPQYTGALTAALPTARAASSGTVTAPTYTGSLAGAVPTPTAAIAGTVTVPSGSATLSAWTPLTQASITGSVTAPTYTATLTAAIPTPRAAVAGTVTEPVTGTFSATVPATKAVLAGVAAVPVYTGVLAAATPVITALIVYVPPYIPAVNPTLQVQIPAPTLTATTAATGTLAAMTSAGTLTVHTPAAETLTEG